MSDPLSVDLPASLGEEGVDLFVVVLGIVVKKNEAADPRAQGEGDTLIKAAVAPTDMAWIFRPVVLRIENQQVAILQEFEQRRLRAFRGGGDIWIGRSERDLVGLVVGQVGDGHAFGGQAEPGAAAGMVKGNGPHFEAPDGCPIGVEFIDRRDPGEGLERDRELERIHLAGERGLEPGPRSSRAENPDFVRRRVSRAEKRQTLDVVPVGVRNEQGEVERLRLQFAREGEAERANPAPGIENNHFVIESQFDAGGIAAVANRLGAGTGNGTAHTPETHDQSRCGMKERINPHNDGGRLAGWRSLGPLASLSEQPLCLSRPEGSPNPAVPERHGPC